MSEAKITPGSIRCLGCHTDLQFLELSANPSIRCCQCGKVFSATSNPSGMSNVNPRSVWSFILGLSSLVCLIFTGIPAILFGMNSLKQIRKSKNQQHGKWLSCIGITSGLVFGVGLTALLLVVVISAGLALLTLEQSGEPAVIRTHLAEVANVELPDDLRLTNSRTVVGIYFIDGEVDHEPRTAPATRFLLVNFPNWLPVLSSQMESQERNKAMLPDSTTEIKEHACTIFGKEATVEEVIVTRKGSEKPSRSKYFTVIQNEYGLYIISIIVSENEGVLNKTVTKPGETPDSSTTGDQPSSQFATQSVPIGQASKINFGENNGAGVQQQPTVTGRMLGREEILAIFKSFKLPD